MTKPVFVLNGANLNLLGMREPHIYGTTTLAEIETMCRERAGQLGLPLEFRQSNTEGSLIDWIQEAIDAASGIVINPAGHSFTSIALLDALKVFRWPIVEVHISNIHRREPHYHRSYVSYAATGVIAGLGAHGYVLALEAVAEMLRQGEPAR
jgi:3-dehydroquinate dehydratase II